MSGKLDQSLEDILGSNRKAGVRGGRGARRGARPSKGRTVAPVGGVQKATKVPKKNVVPTGPAAKGDSKVIVSQLVCYVILSKVWSHVLTTFPAHGCQRDPD